MVPAVFWAPRASRALRSGHGSGVAGGIVRKYNVDYLGCDRVCGLDCLDFSSEGDDVVDSLQVFGAEGRHVVVCSRIRSGSIERNARSNLGRMQTRETAGRVEERRQHDEKQTIAKDSVWS